MGPLELITMCLLSCAAGDISEKLRQGQGFAPPQTAEFSGLLAPFQDGQRSNVKGGRPSGVKGGRPGGVKGGRPSDGAVDGSGRQLGSGASNSANRVPIPFRNHDGDDDENNLDRLCNDAFHSFLCKPVGPRKRIDGKLRPGAKIPPGVLSGASSNVQESKQPLSKSGGALLPTELDNDQGYQYPKPTNNVPSITQPGYSYPKPPYNYDRPPNQLAYPSQVAESVQKPSNEYLPPAPSTPSPTFPPTTLSPAPQIPSKTFGSPVNQIPSQSNVVLNKFPQFPKQITTIQQPITTVSQPTYSVPQSYTPAVNFIYTSTQPATQYTFAPSTVSLPYVYSGFPSSFRGLPSPSEAQASNNEGYIYPKPSNDNPVILTTLQPTASGLAQFHNGYLPPFGAPIPKASNDVFQSLPVSTFIPTFSTFPPTSPAAFLPQQSTFQSTTLRPFTFQPSTVRTTTRRPIVTTPQPTTLRPYIFQSTQTPSTLRPFVTQGSPTTARPPVYQNTIVPSNFKFASSNDVAVAAPQTRLPNNGYLPPVNQPLPSAANVSPVNQPPPFRPTTTPRPTPPPTRPPAPPKPSKEYLPQQDVREGSSTNLSPNVEGGSLLAAEGDAPSPNLVSSPTTERTHTLEELCRDAFHSFLCKPLSPRKRIDGRIRTGAKIPPEVMALLSAASSTRGRKLRPNQSGGGLLATQQNSLQFNSVPAYQPSNLSPQLVARPEPQPSFFLLAASDSSSLAKKYPNAPKGTVSPLYIPPAESRLNSIQTIPDKTTAPSRRTTTVAPTTTQRQAYSTTSSALSSSRPAYTTARLAYTTTRPAYTSVRPAYSTLKPNNLQGAASSPESSSTNTTGQLLSPANKEGYEYPKPAKPFNFPTTSTTSKPKTTGYKYDKPPKPLTYPASTTTTTRPSTGYTYSKPAQRFTLPPSFRFTTSRPVGDKFGQRLRPLQRNRPTTGQQLLAQQQEEQAQFQEDPFSNNEVAEADNGLPPASQFEILKP